MFLLAALVPRANGGGAGAGLLAGLLSLVLVFPTAISPWWYGALTCLPTLLVGVLASYLFPPPGADKVRGLVVTWRGAVEEVPPASPPPEDARQPRAITPA